MKTRRAGSGRGRAVDGGGFWWRRSGRRSATGLPQLALDLVQFVAVVDLRDRSAMATFRTFGAVGDQTICSPSVHVSGDPRYERPAASRLAAGRHRHGVVVEILQVMFTLAATLWRMASRPEWK